MRIDPSDHMAPTASPDTMLRSSGVRRVNNLPVYLLGGVLLLFLIVVGLVAADRAAQQRTQDKEKEKKTEDTSSFASKIVGPMTEGLIKPAKPPEPEVKPEPKPELEPPPVMIAKPTSLEPPPLPPKEDKVDEEAMRILQAKKQQFEQAIRAKTGVQANSPRSSGSAQTGQAGVSSKLAELRSKLADVRQQIEAKRNTDPTAAYQQQAKLNQIRNMGEEGGGGEEPLDTEDAPKLLPASSSRGGPVAVGNSIEQFMNKQGEDRWRLDSKLEAPRTPYELRAGFVVPATLISGINSDLPGQIIGQVAQNVYDTPTGRHLLIPQGSRLVGTYSSDVMYGQSRILVAWQRIVFPDGKAMDIGAMPGTDSAGYAGFSDQVNNHYLRLFGSAVLMSFVVAGVSYAHNNSRDIYDLYGNGGFSNEMDKALANQLGQVTVKMIEKNMNIAPTLEIRPGYRFNVMVTKDMTFSKPYQSFDY